jgi:hypothetical protein
MKIVAWPLNIFLLINYNLQFVSLLSALQRFKMVGGELGDPERRR